MHAAIDVDTLNIQGPQPLLHKPAKIVDIAKKLQEIPFRILNIQTQMMAFASHRSACSMP